MPVIDPRCCGFEVHNSTVAACLRLGPRGWGPSEVRHFGAARDNLLVLLQGVILAVPFLSGCSMEYKAVDHELSTVQNLLVVSSLYETYPCSQIVTLAKNHAARVKQLDDLMAKSGNSLVNAMAYGTDRERAFANQRAAEEAAKRKGCSPDAKD